MKNLLFATNNQHKLSEIRQILQSGYNISSLKEIGCFDELPETQDTLKGNALQKAAFVYQKYRINCFADDTGLEIDALNGAPGVYSARFAGINVTYQQNVDKVMAMMAGIENRSARFSTVIALILEGQEYFFEGTVEGQIINQERGTSGFGYDPVFMPRGYAKTFAEMTNEEKNSISHRGLAVKKLTDFLKGI